MVIDNSGTRLEFALCTFGRPRSIPKTSGLPAELRISSTSLAQFLVGKPLIEIILSPAFKPACFAGEEGDCAVHTEEPEADGMQSLTCAIVDVTCVVPTPIKSPKSSTNPRTKCIVDPAPRTISLRAPVAR